MRTIKQLLELMLENQKFFRDGLCCWALDLLSSRIITGSEYSRLHTYIMLNRPSIWSSVDAYMHSDSVYYWKKNKIKPRIKWIEKHINKLS